MKFPKYMYCIHLYCTTPLNGNAVHHFLSTNNLDIMVNFNCSAPLNSAAYANLTGVAK